MILKSEYSSISGPGKKNLVEKLLGNSFYFIELYIFIFPSKCKYKNDLVLLSKGAVNKMYQIHAISSFVSVYFKKKKTLFHLLSYRVQWSPLNVQREFLSTLVFKFFCWGGDVKYSQMFKQ